MIHSDTLYSCKWNLRKTKLDMATCTLKLTQLCSCNRHLEHSTIIYEDPQHSPLLRLSWNKQDPNYLATFSLDAMEVCLKLNNDALILRV